VSVGASSQFFWGWFECPCQLSSERETRLDDKTMQWCWRLASGRAIVCIYIYPNSLTSTKLCKAAGDWQSHQQKLCKAAGDWQSHRLYRYQNAEQQQSTKAKPATHAALVGCVASPQSSPSACPPSSAAASRSLHSAISPCL
jgi:hypothetical protein